MSKEKSYKLILALSFLFLSAVCWHSVEEIHYLKSFFPRAFSVEDAYYASKVELIKITFITIPILYLTLIAHLILRLYTKAKK